jgi:hypothetical protein
MLREAESEWSVYFRVMLCMISCWVCLPCLCRQRPGCHFNLGADRGFLEMLHRGALVYMGSGGFKMFDADSVLILTGCGISPRLVEHMKIGDLTKWLR